MQPTHIFDLFDHVLHRLVLELAGVAEDERCEPGRGSKRSDKVFMLKIYKVSAAKSLQC
jgi:hypothetical protein